MNILINYFYVNNVSIFFGLYDHFKYENKYDNCRESMNLISPSPLPSF